jgi:hypothetical protein
VLELSTDLVWPTLIRVYKLELSPVEDVLQGKERLNFVLMSDFAQLNAEPALVPSLPDQPTEFDDGLLTWQNRNCGKQQTAGIGFVAQRNEPVWRFS